MYGFTDQEILQRAKVLFISSGIVGRQDAEKSFKELTCQKLLADGSTRRFWRLRNNDKSLGLVVAPAGTSDKELAESQSAWEIGNHLHQKGVPVPETYGWDPETGLLLCEDLGDVRLHDCFKAPATNSVKYGELENQYYRDTLKHLAHMQIAGADGFDGKWCWDSPRYDVEVMLERESGYFLRAFWQGIMEREVDEGVLEEFKDLADRAAEAPATFFLHRDFQSRNIMIKQGNVRFIDFQAGRFGPLGYDVASLLIDPYVALSRKTQEELLEYYIGCIKKIFPLDTEQFSKHFSLLALHRNIQIVGAFSYLSQVKGKQFFAGFIKPALASLNHRLEEPLYAKYSTVCKMVKDGMQEFKLV